MIFLNLSPTLRLLPEWKFESFKFSGGEPHLKIDPGQKMEDRVVVTVQARTTDDFMLAMLAHDALRRMGVKQIELFIPYFPAARQDRVMVPGEALSVKVYARMINTAGFDKVTVFDPHSDVTAALIDRCHVLPNVGFIQQIIAQNTFLQGVTLIAPDVGASKKIQYLAEKMGGAQMIQCTKSRQVENGFLSAPIVLAQDLSGADCLIVDDICDGGGTFIQLAEALKAKNAGKLYLAVSHGIFSRGLEPLLAHFDQIFTTNSFAAEHKHEQLTIIPLQYE